MVEELVAALAGGWDYPADTQVKPRQHRKSETSISRRVMLEVVVINKIQEVSKFCP